MLAKRPASTVDEATEWIDWYRARREIEMLFNVLKNACRVEALQLGTVERLRRTCPELDAALFFEPDEIRGAYLLTEVRQPPAPKLHQVLRLIARLGAFLGRKATANPA